MRNPLLVSSLFALSMFATAQQFTPRPGLTIPNTKTPWALDQYQGKPQLVPVHRSLLSLNSHVGANLAGSLAGSFFYKPKTTSELNGLHARTQIHSSTPVFYLLVDDEELTASDKEKDASYTWAICRPIPDKNKRIFATVRTTQLTARAKRDDYIVDTEVVRLDNGWYRLTPTQALPPGEYAITAVPKGQQLLPLAVFDFGIDANAPPAPDAVVDSN
ncbi:MAG TPA: hypothetical protein VJU82_11545 [Acidobacteriaceae bacterium]|nr:hypothetical protein [Acidobacteriaceae bacterium]